MTLALLLATQPSNILHDPVFQFSVNAGLVILGIIVSIWIYKRQQSKKKISYEILSDASVISVKKEVAPRVKFELDGKSAKDITLVVIRVSNVGTAAITKSDYESPLMFIFKGRKVISCEVVETEPEDLVEASKRKTFFSAPTQAQEYIELPQISLNSKDSITFSVLLDGPKGEVSKKGRIIDGEIKLSGKIRGKVIEIMAIILHSSY